MAPARDHHFHAIPVARVVAETAEAKTFVLDVPHELGDAFAYDAGQFCSFRVRIGDEELIRCYSMSSAPAVDGNLAVTVKRVPGGAVSGWMNDEVSEGDVLQVSPPAGVFRLDGSTGAVVAFAAGSGITPVWSLVKTALAATDRPVRLLYANRDRGSVIFADAIDALAGAHPDRLTVVHRLDVEDGFLDAPAVDAVADGADDPTFYVCGPAPFMDLVESALLAGGAPAERIHIERFTPAAPEVADAAQAIPDGTRVTIELNGKKAEGDHRAGTTILQTARQLGMSPPYSCESGSCATCMAKLVDGEVQMRVNDALTPEEVEEGWILTCQSVPTSPTVHVQYEAL